MAAAVSASSASEAISIKEYVLNSSESVEKGEKTFNTSCALCHGHGGAGGQGRPLNNRSFEAERWFNTISKGRTRGSKRMPPFESSLTENQRWELIAYLKTLNDDH